MTLTIYHNPRCSKSRQTLALLKERGHDPDVRLYLETPLSRADIKALQAQLGYDSVRLMMRTGEAAYKAQNLKAEMDERALIGAILDEPRLLERPIVVYNNRAKMGRPPENVLALFD